MKTLLPILKTKLFLLGFVSACTIVLATTVPQIKNMIAPSKVNNEKIVEKKKAITSKKRATNSLKAKTQTTVVNNSFEATVQTDKPDYSPGEHVQITGSGWVPAQNGDPGETVLLHIVSDCGCTNVTYEAVADENGNIYNDEFLITEAHIGASFTLTATGTISDQTAVTTFTDGNFKVRTISPLGSNVTIQYTFYSDASDCTGTGTSSSELVTANFNGSDFDDAEEGQSYTLTAPATNIAGEPFRFWFVNGPNNELKGSTNLSICVNGRNGAMNVTAYYGTCAVADFPSTPTDVTATPSNVCAGSTTNLSANTGAGNLVYWYTSETGTVSIGQSPSGADFEVTVNETTTYWAEAVSDEGCVNGNRVSVTVNTTPNNTAGAASSTPTLCINTPLTNITHSTTGATGIGAATGLPAGVTAGFASNTVTISGTPTESGTFNYSVPLTGGCGNVSATGSITVTANAAITSVTGTSPLCIGDVTTYSANGVELGGGSGAWSSSNTSAATVNATTGEVTAVGAGTTNIRYTITGGCGGTKYAEQSLTVRPNAAITSVTGSPSTICPGATTTYTANGVVLGGGTGAWSSSDASVASVNSSGVVTGISQGTATITFTITGGCSGTKSAGKLVTVLASTNIGTEKINGTTGTTISYVYGCTSPQLSVVGSGPGAFNTYRWYKSGGTNSGGTLVAGPSLTTPNTFNVPGALDAGTHYYYATYTSTCGTVASQVFVITITQQEADAENDGKLYYNGTCMAWTPTATSNSATVTLAAFVKNKAGDQFTCGDIATARITFQVRNGSGVWTDIPSAQNLPVYYVDPNNPSKGGTANAIVQLNISNNTATQIFDLRVVVSGNYQARPDCGQAQITVSKLIPGGSISGGVLLCGPSSSGLLKPATLAITPSLLGFGVEYTVKGKQVQSPKGKVNLYVPSFFTYEGVNTFPILNWYKISSNAIASLSITSPKATFTAKANVAKYNPVTGETVAIEGNCTMVLDLEDLNTQGQFNFQDKVGITIYRNNGGNWYSNNWVVSKTVPTTICGGDLSVTGAISSALTRSTTNTSTEMESTAGVLPFNVKVFPNPTQHQFSLVLEGATDEKVQIVVYDALGRQVKMFEKPGANMPIRFGMDLKNGVYVVEVRQGDNQKTLKLIKQ